MTQYHFGSYNIMIEYLHMLQTISQISLVDIYLPPYCFQCCLVFFFMIMCTAAHQASLSFTISQSLLKHMSIESVMPSNHLILVALFPLLHSVSLSQGLFQWVRSSHQVDVKYLSFNISPSNEYSGLISFRMDWFHLLAVGGTLKRLLQHHSLKASVLQCSAFFMVQLSHPYMTTGKT